MSCLLGCPRCGSRNISEVHQSDPQIVPAIVADSHCHCQNCGETCRDPAKSAPVSPRLDVTVGFTVLASLIVVAFRWLL